MRAVDIVATAIGNSFRSRLRTTLTVIAIFIGAFTLTLTNGLGAGVNNYIDSQVASIGAPDVMNVSKPVVATAETEGPQPYEESGSTEVSSGVGPPGSTVQAMNDDDLDAIRAIDGVRTAAPIVNVRPDYIEYGTEGKFQLTVSPLSAGIRVELAAGTMFDAAGSNLQIILPTTYIETLGFTGNDDAVGKTVTIAVTRSAFRAAISAAVASAAKVTVALPYCDEVPVGIPTFWASYRAVVRDSLRLGVAPKSVGSCTPTTTASTVVCSPRAFVMAMVTVLPTASSLPVKPRVSM